MQLTNETQQPHPLNFLWVSDGQPDLRFNKIMAVPIKHKTQHPQRSLLVGFDHITPTDNLIDVIN